MTKPSPYRLAPSHGVPASDPRGFGIAPLSVEPYVSAEVFAREREAVFRNSWLLAGRTADVPRPGDFIVFNLDICHASILVVRDEEGRLRGFNNACAHRGARIKYAPRGACKALTCSYHGWVYGLDGRLLDAPHRDLFAGVDWGSVALREVPVDTWGGFVFVNLNPRPANSLRDYLRPLPASLDAYLSEPDWIWYDGFKSIFRANWKLLVDVQIESYHATSLHRRTIGGSFGPREIMVSVYPDSPGVPGRTTEFLPKDLSLIPVTEIGKVAMEYGYSAMYNTLAAESQSDRFPGAINDTNNPRWIFDDYPIFPNVVILVLQDQVLLQRSWPLSPHETLWEMDWLFKGEARNFGEVFSREQAFVQARDTITEDMTTVEGLQANFRSGAVMGMVTNDMEVLLRMFRRRLEAALGKGTVP